MRILWVKIGGLWPPDRGGRLRSFHTIAELARRHRVIVATTHAPDEAHVSRETLPGCEAVISIPHRLPKQGEAAFAWALARSWASPLPVDAWKARVPALRGEVARRLEAGGIDVCVADFLAAWPNVPQSDVPTVLFEHNVEHAIWRRLHDTETRALRRQLLAIEWRKMRRFEARACARADLTVAVSEADRALLAVDAPTARIRAVPTGVDTAFFAPDDGAEREGRLVFTGSMDWYPNEDAVLHFIDAMLPLIRREVPGVSLAIVGRRPSERLAAAARRAGVEVTGTVDDVRPHVATAAVCVVPLRVGGGTRLKIFEALAMGKAVVSTSVGAEGLPLSPGEHYLCADDPAAFARETVGLLRDAALRRRLGAAGRALVEARHSWTEVGRQFERLLDEAMTQQPQEISGGARALLGAIEGEARRS
jgi:glycosyltransferase involved in cell wall biosynthesis